MAIEHITKPTPPVVTKPRPIGRPTKYSIKLITEICDLIANGNSLRSICERPEMPAINNVRLWLIKYDEFRVRYAHARDDQADYYADEILRVIREAPATRDEIERAKVEAEALKWIASKLKPKKYGDKLDLTSDGERIEQPIYGGASLGKKPVIEGEIVKPKRLPKSTGV